jgi:hypothetical protein
MFETLIDLEYLQARLARLGGKGAALLKLVVAEGSSVEQAEYTLRQGVGREDLPIAIQKVLPGDLVIERTETWRRTGPGSYHGTVAARVPGATGKITGTLRLVDLADVGAGRPGSELAMDGSAEVQIPLIGGKIEAMIAEQVQRLIDRENRFTLDWLGQ